MVPIIYVVDDDETARTAAEMVLVSAGHLTQAFDGVDRFLREVQPNRAGCIVMDPAEGARRGIDVISLIRERHPSIPVLIMSSRTDVAIVVASIKRGAFDFLAKPVAPSLLVEKVAEALTAKTATPVPPAPIAALQSRMSELTTRELEVLRQLVAGKPSKLIAA